MLKRIGFTFSIGFLSAQIALGACASLFSPPSTTTNRVYPPRYESRGVVFEVVREDSASRRECFEMMKENMLSERYGLRRWEDLSPDYVDHGHHVYFSARDRTTGELMGTFRLIPNFEINRFDNFFGGVKEDWPFQSGEVFTAGTYYKDHTSSPKKKHLFLHLFRMAYHYAQANGGQAFYMETRPIVARYLQKIGSKTIGEEFKPKSWNHPYRPMVWDFNIVERGFRNADFRKRWREETGSRMDVEALEFIYAVD